jgi:hypothetical protein
MRYPIKFTIAPTELVDAVKLDIVDIMPFSLKKKFNINRNRYPG